ncbi:uncharacterized protein LOC127725593 [Mytilus californianus]|uniref:uncharacterized protein LOC127725593 n=1 Tax=Mytilus californianus TaxID=6549 RepID=UPI0022468F97|nr:uncharacterized protein LOC127725593 [Mytilus californianus]
MEKLRFMLQQIDLSTKHLDALLTNFKDIDPFLVNYRGETFLHVYLYQYSTHGGTDLDRRLLSGEIPAISKQTLEKLLNCQNNKMNSPFHMFIREWINDVNETTLEKFVEAGANVNFCNIHGETPLHCLFRKKIDTFEDDNQIIGEEERNKLQESIKILVRKGADVNTKNKEGESPLFLANHVESVNALLDMGAEINLPNNLKQTPLLVSIRKSRENIDLVNVLLYRGAAVNAIDIHGSNILHYIAWYGVNADVLDIVTAYGVNVVADNLGQLPCLVAYQRGHDIFDRLCKCGHNGHCNGKQFVLKKESIEFSDLEDKSTRISSICHRFHTLCEYPVSELLLLPSFGQVVFEEEAKLVKEVVTDLVTDICEKIKESNEMLSSILMDSGSVGENTRVGLPDEFDFIFILDKFGDICYIDEQKSVCDVGYAYMKVKDEFRNGKHKGFFDRDGYLDTFKIRSEIQAVPADLFTKRDIFNHPNISFLRDHYKSGECPTCNFTIRWVGCMYKDMKIDIDLVPACQIKGWWPDNCKLDLLSCDVKTIKREGALLMLQTALVEEYQPHSKQRISALCAEKSQMLNLPKLANDAYIISKILCSNRICPSLRLTRENIEAKDVLTSYMLKNCLFHVVNTLNCQDNQMFQTDSSLNYKQNVHEFVLRIFHKLLEFSRKGTLPSFVFPWQNVFTFNSEVYLARSANHLYKNTLRCTFAKEILQILGEEEDYRDINTDVLFGRYVSSSCSSSEMSYEGDTT